jgi:hypothetical protein
LSERIIIRYPEGVAMTIFSGANRWYRNRPLP